MLSPAGMPEKENYTLQYYNAAIFQLQQHLASGNKNSIRIVAISCLIFVCLEFMRGNIETGVIHLQNGLNLLPLLQPQSRENGTLVLKAHNESLEDGVTEAFLRLFVCSAQFHRFSRNISIVTQDYALGDQSRSFPTIAVARQHLDELFNRIHRLEADARQLQALSCPVTTAMLQKQQRIQTDLDCWLSLFNNSFAGIANRDLEESLPLTLLRIHHTMAYIMAGTSLAPRNELAYDQFKSSFDSIISLSDRILEAAASIMAADIIHGVCTEQFSFSADMGIILPLYYTILKCRCPIARRRALKLLLPVSHQEGIWNGPLSAAIARRVIQIEEDGYYRCYPIEDLALQKSVITPIPILLESHRISDVFIEPLESSTGGIIWSYQRTQENGQLSVWEESVKAFK
ncbi:transcriptional regulatory moc3 [Fusarium napiforme]|uniref:Transcriptional regulatory moc3 n=1 Tax=Fusarium napiforme TaxID=42672 RepID=A0A8H5JR50_9HYPO|nr:transcriptional regulatory moc3 [Fusarium napiforme]